MFILNKLCHSHCSLTMLFINIPHHSPLQLSCCNSSCFGRLPVESLLYSVVFFSSFHEHIFSSTCLWWSQSGLQKNGWKTSRRPWCVKHARWVPCTCCCVYYTRSQISLDAVFNRYKSTSALIATQEIVTPRAGNAACNLLFLHAFPRCSGIPEPVLAMSLPT